MKLPPELYIPLRERSFDWINCLIYAGAVALNFLPLGAVAVIAFQALRP